MRVRGARILAVAAGVSLTAGCAQHRPPSPADRFLLHRHADRTTKAEAPPEPSLEEAIGKMRQLMATARPAPKAPLETLENTDPVLAAAFRQLAAARTADTLYDVGAAYHRRGLLDQAQGYYSQSLHMDPAHAPTYEALARLWRDWHFPQLGLGDAYRAIYYAPHSASARNTLGTILQALSLRADARAAYTAALRLDSQAGYALNNLCYLSFTEGKASQAIDECRAALRLDPDLPAAHNNLALTYAAMGRMDIAKREFAEAGPAATADYNLGIVYLAQKQYGNAADAFDAARSAQPSMIDAERRAQDARRLAALETSATGGR